MSEAQEVYSEKEMMQILKAARPTQDGLGSAWRVDQSMAVQRNQSRDTRFFLGYNFDSKSNNRDDARIARLVNSATYNNVNINYGSIGAGADKSVNFSVADSIPTDLVSATFTPDLPSGVTLKSAYVSTGGTTTITLHNNNGSSTSLVSPTSLFITVSRLS